MYVDKLKNSIYSKRINSPLNILESGKSRFENLDVKEQAKTLLSIHQVFGRMTGGCDLDAIGGKKNSASTKSGFSSTISNWKKYYSDVRIIDSSVSGLWEKQSDNLLELL